VRAATEKETFWATWQNGKFYTSTVQGYIVRLSLMDDTLVTIIKRGRKHNISNFISKIINIQFWMPAGWGCWFFFFSWLCVNFSYMHRQHIYYRPEPLFKMLPSIIIFAWWCSHHILYMWNMWCDVEHVDVRSWMMMKHGLNIYYMYSHSMLLLSSVYSVMDGIFWSGEWQWIFILYRMDVEIMMRMTNEIT
jgi:hypothetical protein